MRLVLIILGVGCISAALLLFRKQQHDFLDIQEQVILRAQESGAQELEALVEDLKTQLAEATRLNIEQLEVRAQELRESTSLDVTPVISEVEGREVAASVDCAPETTKEPVALGQWSQREKLVREMFSLGMKADVIAKELGIGKGEVQLILDLSRSGD